MKSAATPRRLRRSLTADHQLQVDRIVRRIDVQLHFAERFAAALGRSDWQELVGNQQAVVDAASPADLAGLESLAIAVETALAPVGEAAKAYTVHCVGHGHIDMNWMWGWHETVSATHDTFASVLELMDEYPELTYSQSQTSVYELVRRHHPAMFERIRQRVAEGRWEVAAVHWVEGDKNLASGEALCQHLLLTRRWFAEAFGLSPEDVPVDWEPDTFGHAHTVPSFLAQGAAKYYYSCRQGGGHEAPRLGDPRPPLFWWKAPDGSRVLVNRELSWYNSYVNIGDDIAAPLTEAVAAHGLHHWLNVFGIGNHGGGPTRRELDWFRELQSFAIYPQLVFSTARRYFEAVEAEVAERGIDLPVVDQELNFEFPGCYVSQSVIKQANRHGERLCQDADALATLAALDAGLPFPDENLREAWTRVLFSQFHDILPGSGVRETRECASSAFQEVKALTASAVRDATQALTADIDVVSLLPDGPAGDEDRSAPKSAMWEAGAGLFDRGHGLSQVGTGGGRWRAVTVWNPCAWARREIVEVVLYDAGFDASCLIARDENGRQSPVFRIDEPFAWGHHALRVRFVADLPSLGFRTFLIGEGDADEGAGFAWDGLGGAAEGFRVDLSRPMLAGPRIELDGRGVASPFAWRYQAERGLHMTAWLTGPVTEDAAIVADEETFFVASPNEGTGYRAGRVPLVAVTQRARCGSGSSISARTTVFADAPRLEVEAEVDWREIGAPGRIPRLTVGTQIHPLQGASAGLQADREIPFGFVPAARLGSLEPSLNAVRLGAGGLWAVVTQDRVYGHQFTSSGVDQVLIRSSIDPDPTPEIAVGRFRFGLTLHAERPSDAEVARLGAAFQLPPVVAPVRMRRGSRPTTASYAEVVVGDVVLTTVKRAADGRGVVLRAVNYGAESAEAVVRLAPALAPAGGSAAVVDVLERPAGGEARLVDGRLVVRVPGRSFVNVRVG